MASMWNQLAAFKIQVRLHMPEKKVAMYTQLAAECAQMYQDAKHAVRKADLQASAELSAAGLSRLANECCESEACRWSVETMRSAP